MYCFLRILVYVELIEVLNKLGFLQCGGLLITVENRNYVFGYHFSDFGICPSVDIVGVGIKIYSFTEFFNVPNTYTELN